MGHSIRFVGMDVHADTIAVAVAERGGEVRALGTIPNRPEAVRKVVNKLGAPETLRACYEAGPCGYVLYWQLTVLGVHCDVVAPTLVPVKAGERVKTDRRDAQKLARSYRAGDLTPVWVPDGDHEALRDLVRAREAAKKDQLRARHRLGKFLLRRGHRPPSGTKSWSTAYRRWLGQLRFERLAQAATYADYCHEVDHAGDRLVRLERAIDDALAQVPVALRAVIAGLQALRGVAKLTAVTLVAEVGQFTRFPTPRELMAYSGTVAREHSSGGRLWRGGITKTGNAHLRRILTEAAWTYRHRPAVGAGLRARQRGLSDEVKALAWKAQHRLHGRYQRLLARGKPSAKAITAVARELLGFAWAIAGTIEEQQAAAAR